MSTDFESLKLWLVDCIGHQLVHALGAFHVFETKKNGQPLAVSFLFLGAEMGTIKCAPDGASIAYSSDEVAECDLGEYGEEKVFLLADDACFSTVMGKKLTSFALISSSVEKTLVGAQLHFKNSLSVSIVNLGDELIVYNNIPLEIISCQGLDFIDFS